MLPEDEGKAKKIKNREMRRITQEKYKRRQPTKLNIKDGR
jgi:hypothetical protein